MLAVRAHPTPDARDIERFAMVSLPLAALIILSSALGLALAKAQRLALAVHGAAFLAAAVAEFSWGISLLFQGIPAGNFSWSVGLFSISVAYAVFVFSRFTVLSRFRAVPSIYFSPALALAAAVPVDIGVIVRFTYELNSPFGG